MANDALMGRIMRDQRPGVMRMEGELGPEAGAAAYEALVREHLGASPRWDLMLLGLGPDAHCASLFPGKPEVAERKRLVTGVELAGMEPQVPRISLTLPALNAARTVVFLVTGKDKAKAVKRAFGDPPDPASPAAFVRPPAGELIVLLDEAAAGELS
jgi:6-phosphogluconolactonase